MLELAENCTGAGQETAGDKESRQQGRIRHLEVKWMCVLLQTVSSVCCYYTGLHLKRAEA